MDKILKHYTDYYTNAYNEQRDLFENAKTTEELKALSKRYFINTEIKEIGKIDIYSMDLITFANEVETIKKNVPRNVINTLMSSTVDDDECTIIIVLATVLTLKDKVHIESLVNWKVKDAEHKMHYQPNSKEAIHYRKILEND